MKSIALIIAVITLCACSPFEHGGFDLSAYGGRSASSALASDAAPCCGQVCMTEAGDGATDNTLSLQAAVTLAQNTTGVLLLPNGDYKISAPITFLSKSLRITGAGATSTGISQFPGTPITLFNMSNIGGPSVLVENLSFNGPVTGGYGGTGIYASASNGIILRNVWFRGLTKGVHKINTASYVSQQHCVFEFCVVANHYEDGVQCTIADPVYYRNLTDLLLTGDGYSFIHSNSQHGETRTNCIHLSGVKGAQITGITCRQDFDTALPDIVRFDSGCAFNTIDRITTRGFGRVVVTMVSGGGSHNNFIRNVMASNEPILPPSYPAPVRTLAAVIEIGSGNDNNSLTGIHAASCALCLVDVGYANHFRDVSASLGSLTTWIYP